VCRRLGGTKRAWHEQGILFFSFEKERKIINWRQEFFKHYRIVSAVKRVELVSDRVSYVVLRGRFCNSIVPNVLAPSEGKSDDSKDSFY